MGDAEPPVANAYPATTGDIIKMLTMSLGLIYFIVKIFSDARTSLLSKPHTQWIPGKALVLTALGLQILTYLDYKSVSISEVPDLNQANMLFGDQLVIDSGRLVICVFIGYVLPTMARPGSAEKWTDIAALVVSIFAAVISELYYIHETTKATSTSSSQTLTNTKAWFIGSSIAILVSTVMLILFVVSATLAGKTIRGLLTQRILHVMKSPSKWLWDKSEEEINSGKCSWNDFKDEMVRSWLLCRVGQPQYVITRSVLSSSTGLMVTACIALVVTKGIVLCYFRSFIPRYDGWDWLRHITFSLQCAFVLMGWMVICWRWLSAVICFSGLLSSTRKSISKLMHCQRSDVEDFWTRSVHELKDVYDLHAWRLKLYKRPRKGGGVILSTVTKFNLYRLSFLFWRLQISLVLFSKGCWYVSEMMLMLLGFKFVRSCMVGGDKSFLCCGNNDEDDEDFQKYEKELEHLCMPGESAESLWFANVKSFRQARDCLYANQRRGPSPYGDLKTLLEALFPPDNFCDGVPIDIYSESDRYKPKSFVEELQKLKIDEQYQPVKEYFPFLQKNCWKLTAVSLIKIIVTVLRFYKGDEHPRLKVEEAYKQAWEYMTFVDNSRTKLPDSANPTEVFDIEVDQLSVAADKEFKMLGQSVDSLTTDNPLTAKASIEKLRGEAEEQLKVHLISTSRPQQTTESQNPEIVKLQDSKDWNIVASSYSMYRVSELILSRLDRNISVGELLKELNHYIADVMGNCLLKLPEALVTRCRDWATMFQEDEIWDALSTAQKAITLIEEMWPGVQFVSCDPESDSN